MREFPGQGNSLVRGNLWKTEGLAKGILRCRRGHEDPGISKVPKRPGEVHKKRWFGAATFRTLKIVLLESRHRAAGCVFGSGVEHNQMRASVLTVRLQVGQASVRLARRLRAAIQRGRRPRVSDGRRRTEQEAAGKRISWRAEAARRASA